MICALIKISLIKNQYKPKIKLMLTNINHRINAHDNSNINFIQHGSKILKFCTQVKKEYLEANNVEKKEILKTVFLQNRKLRSLWISLL